MTLAAIYVVASSLAPPPAALASVSSAAQTLASHDTIAAVLHDSSAVAAPDTSGRDTTAAIEADTSVVERQKAMWTMDELKRVLGEETGGIKAYKERKSGRVAMACAVLVPGLGQIYNEKPIKAGIALGLEAFYLSQIAMNRRMSAREKVLRDVHTAGSYDWRDHDRWVTEYWERSVDWIWWSGAVILGIVIDAYVDAKLDDMRFKIEARASKGDVGVSLLVRY